MLLYNGRLYWTEETAMTAVMEDHPEISDDDLPNFFDSHVEEIDLYD